MHQFRTDALSIAMIVGGATLAAGATLLLASAGEEAETATRCSHEATAQKVFEEQQRVVVALNGGERSVVVGFAWPTWTSGSRSSGGLSSNGHSSSARSSGPSERGSERPSGGSATPSTESERRSARSAPRSSSYGLRSEPSAPKRGRSAPRNGRSELVSVRSATWSGEGAVSRS